MGYRFWIHCFPWCWDFDLKIFAHYCICIWITSCVCPYLSFTWIQDMWTNCVFMRLAWEAVTCQVQWNLQFSNTIETQLIQQTVICITIKYSNVLALPQHFTNRLSLTLLELNGGGDAGTDTFSSHPTFVFRSCQYNNVILTRSNEYDNICKQTTCRCIDMFQHASLALRSKLLQLLHQAVSQSASVILSCLLSGFHVHLCVIIVFHETKFDSTHLYGCCLVIQCCDCCLVKIVPAHGPTTPSNWYGRRAAGGFASGTSLIHHTVGQCVYLDVYKSDTRDQLLWRCRFSLHNIDQYKAG